MILDSVMYIVQCVSDIISVILLGMLGIWFVALIFVVLLAAVERLRECLNSPGPVEPIKRKRIEWIRTLPDDEFKYAIYKAYRASGGWWTYVETLEQFRKDVGLEEIKLYCCEICGTNYNNKTTAKACEKNHKTPLKANGCKWKPKSVEDDGYPLGVVVEFSDGSKVLYKKGRQL